MAYREVEMVEIKEALRLWLEGKSGRQVGRQVGIDRKTVRSYIAAGGRAGLTLQLGVAALTDEVLAAVLADLRPPTGRPHGEAWALCERERVAIAGHLAAGVRLSKARKLLERSGSAIPYSTLHRFAVEVLGFGRTAPTVPVADGMPGEELEVDTGWVLSLPDEGGRMRRVRAWIFTANVSRHRFVWPSLTETTESAIVACEAAWEFYGGVFRVLRPDNTKAIVVGADPLYARITPAFLEYAQARGFHVDAARVRSPKDKARVERSVRVVRDDCFAGEKLLTLDDSRARARSWCESDYGMRRHTRTQRMPREHFDTVEKPALLPAPAEPYDVPRWSDPKVGRDHFAQVDKALYTLPTRFIGKKLRARADRALVRFFDNTLLVKVHPRQPPGGKSVDASDLPPEKAAYAMRDVAFLEREAHKHGAEIARFAKALLDGPLPWTRMRHVYALLGLCKRYGDARVEETCAIAIAAEMIDVHRLGRMLARAVPSPTPTPPGKVIPLARHLRPVAQYALPLGAQARSLGEQILAAVADLSATVRFGDLVPLPALRHALAQAGCTFERDAVDAELLDLERSHLVDLRIAQSPATLSSDERPLGIDRPDRGLVFYVSPRQPGRG